MNVMAEMAAYAVMKRSGMHIAAAMIHGSYEERERAWDAAVEIEEEVGGFVELVQRSIQMLGYNPELVWVRPSAKPEQADQVPYKAAFLSCRKALVDFIAFALACSSDERWDAANKLLSAMNAIGLEMDGPVDYVLARQTDAGMSGRTRPVGPLPQVRRHAPVLAHLRGRPAWPRLSPEGK